MFLCAYESTYAKTGGSQKCPQMAPDKCPLSFLNIERILCKFAVAQYTRGCCPPDFQPRFNTAGAKAVNLTEGIFNL
jgi:hypothetical protein